MPLNPTTRLQALSAQLPSNTFPKMSPPDKDPITCHVLDTTTGRPATGIRTTLSCRSSPSPPYVATTNADGRIVKWEAEISSQPSIASLIEEQGEQGEKEGNEGEEGDSGLMKGQSVWKLTFDTGAYYGAGKTFWPVVELSFCVREGEHFHVPLLLGPHSYTTYRGS